MNTMRVNGAATGTDHGAARLAEVEAILSTITDPEIPVVTIRELGILRSVSLTQNQVEIVITPTYSACPAIEQIRDDIAVALKHLPLEVVVRQQLTPAWTTDWMTPTARDKLLAYGIAPPHGAPGTSNILLFAPKNIANYSALTGTFGTFYSDIAVNCPQCGSDDTTETSHFGSTACKALYRCLSCMEPFDYFKPY